MCCLDLLASYDDRSITLPPRLAYDLMNNVHANSPKPTATSTPGAVRARYASDGGSPSSVSSHSPCDNLTHVLAPLRSLEGYDGGMQQRCVMCNKPQAWYCVTCTKSVDSIVPVCPEFTVPRKGENRGEKVYHPCLARHCLNPSFFPKGRVSATKKAKRAKSNECAVCDAE